MDNPGSRLKLRIVEQGIDAHGHGGCCECKAKHKYGEATSEG
jgi:hypothetical protein